MTILKLITRRSVFILVLACVTGLLSAQSAYDLVLRAEAHMSRGEYNSAYDDFLSASRLKEGTGDYGLSRIYAIRGDAANAVKYLEKDMGSPGRKSEKVIMLDPAFSRIENTPEWRQFWKKDWSTRYDEELTRIQDLLTGGKKEEAVKSLTALLSSEPYNQKYLALLAQIQVNMLNYSGASSTYSKMIGLEIPDATLFLKRADCYIKTGELKNASADLDKYISFYPGNSIAIRMSGKIKAASGDNLGALAAYSENIRLHPGEAECFNDRANAYFVSKSWDWAIRDYTMSLDLAPGNSDVWLNKGIALLSSGKESDACHDFRMAFNLGNKKATDYISRYCIK